MEYAPQHKPKKTPAHLPETHGKVTHYDPHQKDEDEEKKHKENKEKPKKFNEKGFNNQAKWAYGNGITKNQSVLQAKQQKQSTPKPKKITSLFDLKGEVPETLSYDLIKQTKEYDDFIFQMTNKWHTTYRVSTSEAILACQLMLRAINGGKTSFTEDEKAAAVFDARKRIGNDVPISEVGRGKLTDTLLAVLSINNTDAQLASSVQILTNFLRYTSFKELDQLLKDPDIIAKITKGFKSYAPGFIETAIKEQIKKIVDKYNSLHKETVSGKDPAGLKSWEKETGVSVGNPYIGVPKELLEIIYRASINTGEPPSVLLALKAKEGYIEETQSTLKSGKEWSSTPNIGSTSYKIKNSTEAAIFERSYVFWEEMGTDNFTAFAYSQSATDNVLDTDLSKHNPVFNARINELKKNAFLRPDFTAEKMTSEIKVSETKKGLETYYQTKPSAKFYEYAFELASAYFLSLNKNKFALLDNDSPSRTLNYSQWNSGTKSFQENLLKLGNKETGKTGKGLENWVLHEKPPGITKTEPNKGQVRRNVIRFGMYLKAYEKLFQ